MSASLIYCHESEENAGDIPSVRHEGTGREVCAEGVVGSRDQAEGDVSLQEEAGRGRG